MERAVDPQIEARLVSVVPSERQIRHQQMGFYAFIHFTINTFTGREWGDGTEDPALFNPVRLDVTQWVQALKAAGMKALILTCKHHDGFCLWPSQYTDHTVAASPFRGGRGDVVREVSEACRAEGLRFGVYLSPWDRNQPVYGQGIPYDDYFVHQLEELLTGYGEICSVWFDGACGEGPNGKKQQYDWERYYRTIRRLQPGACIHVCGPDVRWCGNEAGYTRESEWSVVPERTRETEKIAAASQQEDSARFRERRISASDADLGSYDLVKQEEKLVWYPAEVNTSIRPGWFYHAEEDNRVRSLSELIHIYESAVGGNATFLLNIPPTPEGLLHENDVNRLRELGDSLRNTYGNNLLDRASLTADAWEPGHEIECARSDDDLRYFKTEDGVRSCRVTVSFPRETLVRRVVLKENIRCSQRVEHFRFLAGEREIYRGTVIGYQKIVALPPQPLKEMTLEITDARVAPTLAFIGVY